MSLKFQKLPFDYCALLPANITAVCDNVDCGRDGVCEPISATEYQCRCPNGTTSLESCFCGGVFTGTSAALDLRPETTQ